MDSGRFTVQRSALPRLQFKHYCAHLLYYLLVTFPLFLILIPQAYCQTLLWQTNSAGDDVHIIDIETKQLVKRLVVGPEPHGIAAPKKTNVVYISVEHNHQVVGTIEFSDSLRPPALMANQQYYFQHVDGLNGFEVANIPKREVTARIHHNNTLGYFTGIKRLGWINADGLHRCHGLAIRRNQSEIWSTCGHHLNIHSLTGHTLEKNQQENFTYPETHHINLKDDGYWLTFSPNDRFAFIALRDANEVVMIDTTSKETITHLIVGEKPKRNLVIEINNK